MSALDSGSRRVQGGRLNLLHSLQCCKTAVLSISALISIYALRHCRQVFDWLGSIMTPQRQHRLKLVRWNRLLTLSGHRGCSCLPPAGSWLHGRLALSQESLSER